MPSNVGFAEFLYSLFGLLVFDWDKHVDIKGTRLNLN